MYMKSLREKMRRETAAVLCGAMVVISMQTAFPAYAETNMVGVTGSLAEHEKWGGIITGNITNLDFSDYQFKSSTDTRKTVDSTFIGYIDTVTGSKEADLKQVNEGKGVLELDSVSAAVNSYQSGLKRTERFGVEYQVRFNDTVSKRMFCQMRGLPGSSSGDYAWPTLLTYTNAGKINDSTGRVIGTYEANIWYTVKLDINTETQTYRVLIEGEHGSSLSAESTLNAAGGGDRIWRGLSQNKLVVQESAAVGTHNTTEIAYVKAGDICVGIEEFVLEDMKLDQGKGKVFMPSVIPDNAYAGGLGYTSSDETVIKFYENGMLAVGTGTAEVTVSDSFTGKSGSFHVTVTEPDDSWKLLSVSDDVLNCSVSSGKLGQIDFDEEQVRELFTAAILEQPEYYKDMQDGAFIEAVKKDIRTLSNPTDLEYDKYELLSRYLVLMHRLHPEEWEYARKAAMILYYQAQYYPHILLFKEIPFDSVFKESEFLYGENAVFAFGYLLGLEKNGQTVWESIAPAGIPDEEMKRTVSELYLRPLADNCMDRALRRPGGLNNIDVYGARSTTVVARILDDPYLMRKVIMLYDSMMSGHHYYFDGMWEEGTTSYGDQVSGNIAFGIDVIAGYTDPEWYADPDNPEDYGLNEAVIGLELVETDLNSRWILLERTKNLTDKLKYPDGSPIAINDSHFAKELEMNPIDEDRLHNIEMPGLGYWGLVQGNGDGAVHAGLLYQSRQQGFAGSHDHANVLAMNLWGAGTELLPDTGYVVQTNYTDGTGATLRYPSMRPVFHNMPWVFRNDGKNETGSKE